MALFSTVFLLLCCTFLVHAEDPEDDFTYGVKFKALPKKAETESKDPASSAKKESAVSKSDPTTPSKAIVASSAGFPTLGDYVKYGHKLIEEQRQAEADLMAFRKKMKRLAQKHRELAREYAVQAEKTRDAINRMAQIPDDSHGPAASKDRSGGFDPSPMLASMPALARGPSSLSAPRDTGGFAPEPLSRAPASASEKVSALDDTHSFDGKLDMGVRNEKDEDKKSTIAVHKAEDGPGAAKPKLSKYILGKADPKTLEKLKKRSLRDALKDAMMSKGLAGADKAVEESRSSVAAKAVLEEFSGQGGASVTGSSGGASEEIAAASPFRMEGSETEAEMRRLQEDLKTAPEVLGRESAGLFERVREAHKRSQKSGRVAVARS